MICDGKSQEEQLEEEKEKQQDEEEGELEEDEEGDEEMETLTRLVSLFVNHHGQWLR